MPTITKRELEEKELVLMSLENDIEVRKLAAEEREQKLMDEEIRISEQQALLTEKEQELNKLRDTLGELEQTIAAAQDAGQPPPPAPRPPRKRLRYRCIKKCYHWIGVNTPHTRRIYDPGEEYFAFEDEDVPKHFMRIDDVADDFKAKKIAADASQKNLPPYLAKKTATVHG